jgi:DNA-binding NarL/FixJ family response regulator
MKRAGGARLVESIREVLAGRIAVSPEVSTRLLEDYSGRSAPRAVSEISQLTNREFEVFRLMGEARTNREIAGQLHLSPKTVETHRLAILRKLKLRNTAELVRHAIQFLNEEAGGGLRRS